MKLWQQQPTSVKVCAIALVVICVIDFSQRIWVSAELAARSTTEFNAGRFTAPTPKISEPVQTFLEDLASAAEPPAEAEDENSENKIPLIEGGVNIGEMRVRVRAIYISPTTNKQAALIEAQHLTERNLELTEVTLGYALNNYQVSEITVDSVVFTGSDQNDQITIPVFDY